MNRIIAFAFVCGFICSCSSYKQIAKSAKNDVLETIALANAHVGISIYEPSTGKYWFDYQGDKFFVPASNTKIPTCYAAMKYLGDSLTGILYNENSDGITVIGAGDPTFLHPDFKNHPVMDFLKSIPANKKLSLQEIQKPYAQNSGIAPFGSGWSWNDYNENYMAERNFFPIYGNIAQFTIKDGKVVVAPRYLQSKVFQQDKIINSFEVNRVQHSNAFFVTPGSNKYQEVPIKQGLSEGFISVEDSLLSDTLHRIVNFSKGQFPGGTVFKTIKSQPVDSMLKPMMHRSDNFFAEQVITMVSMKLFGWINEGQTRDSILKSSLGNLPQKPRWADGSGLSRYNLFTPQDMVAILGKMKTEFGIDRIRVIFATGGEGTISSYYKADSGFIYAKTGTLSGVVALSGFLTTKNNRELIFSVLVNNHQSSATEVRRAVEKFIQGVRNNY